MSLPFGTAPTDDHASQSVSNQTSQGLSDFVNGSQAESMYRLYLEKGMETVNGAAQHRRQETNGLIIFATVFSGVIAVMLQSSLNELRPKADSSLPFSPPVYAIWVNVLWAASLFLNFIAAVLADLLSGWSKWLTKVTQPRYEPHKQARIHVFFLENAHKSYLPAVETLPSGMLHLSVFLFFVGVIIYMWQSTLIVAKLLLSLTIVCTTFYGYFTFIPIIRPNTLYHTPFSLPAWYLVTGILFATFRALQMVTVLGCFSHATYRCIRSLAERNRQLLRQGMQRTAEEIALRSPSDIRTYVLMWTLSKLDNDHELERFISSVPGFLCSPVVDNPLPRFNEERKKKFLVALIRFLDVTFAPDLLPEPVRDRRAAICKRAFDQVEMLYVYKHILMVISSGGQNYGLQTPEFGCVMKGWPHSDRNLDMNQETGLIVKAIFTNIIVGSQQRNDSWFILASDEMGVPEVILRNYATHGASLSLAILIHVIRLQFDHFWVELWPKFRITNALWEASKFVDVQNTLPDLRRNFCVLWNQIVLRARDTNDGRLVESEILEPIRKVFTDLHQDATSTGEPWFPVPYVSMVCDDPSHNIPKFGTITTQAGPAHNPGLASTSSVDNNAPSSSVSAIYHAGGGLMDVSPPASSLIRRPPKTPAPPLPRI